jgi:hypothetical protein
VPPLHASPVALTCASCAQLCPHAPQFATSVPERLTHVPEQSVVPEGHWQEPPWQVAPPVHAVHDAPQ